MYGQDVVILVEITVRSLKVAKQNQLSHIDYESAMLAELDDINSSFKFNHNTEKESCNCLQ